MVLMIHYRGDSKILNSEYERNKCNSSEDEFTEDITDEDEQEVED